MISPRFLFFSFLFFSHCPVVSLFFVFLLFLCFLSFTCLVFFPLLLLLLRFQTFYCQNFFRFATPWLRCWAPRREARALSLPALAGPWLHGLPEAAGPLCTGSIGRLPQARGGEASLAFCWQSMRPVSVRSWAPIGRFLSFLLCFSVRFVSFLCLLSCLIKPCPRFYLFRSSFVPILFCACFFWYSVCLPMAMSIFSASVFWLASVLFLFSGLGGSVA